MKVEQLKELQEGRLKSKTSEKKNSIKPFHDQFKEEYGRPKKKQLKRENRRATRQQLNDIDIYDLDEQWAEYL